MSRKRATPERWRNAIVRYANEPPESLLANPQNWRVHPREQTAALTGSLTELGWIAPVIVNETTQHVVDGHARIGEAISRGEPTVPVAYVQLTEDQERLALATFDPIAAMAGIDQKMLDDLLAGLSTSQDGLSALLASLATKQPKVLNPDDADLTPPTEPITKPGDLWLLGDHRLLCGDSLNDQVRSRLLAGQHADAVFIDPPFTFGLASSAAGSGKANGWADLMNSAVWFAEVFRACRSALGGEGPLWSCCNWRTLPAVMRAADGADWSVESLVVWDKDWIGPGGVRGLRPSYELVALLVAGDYCIPDRGIADVWKVPWSSHKPSGHPAEKPVALVEKALEASGAEAETVLDLFGGSGTTLIACEQLGRRALVCEDSPKWADVTVRRWEHVTGRKAERVGQAVEAHA